MPKLTGLAASRWADPSLDSRLTSHPTAAITPIAAPGALARSIHNSSRIGNNKSHLISCNTDASPQRQIARFSKIAARLKWKIPFLETGYSLAVDRIGKPQEEADANEIHFKLDFHEFYMLIERALVHLMGVYGIVIYAQPDADGHGHGIGDLEQKRRVSFRDQFRPHRYHENVLLALDDPKNPLHETLGRPEVRKQLWRAKDLRNQWKDADDSKPGRFMPAPLEAYNLKEILQTILLALEWAFLLADKYVHQHDPDAHHNQPPDSTTNLEDWEFIVDAMDWEAV